MSKILDEIRGFANSSFAEHKLTERLNDGLFRSYRCQKPGTWVYGFDVTFWPGWVAISGDIGELMLSRDSDMMPWLRGVLKRDTIDLSYVAEKSPNNIVTREWTVEAAKSVIETIIEYRTEDDPDADVSALRELLSVDEQYEWNTVTVPSLIDQGYHDFYGYGDAKDWTARFIWCVLALQWFVRAFDAATEETVIVASAAV